MRIRNQKEQEKLQKQAKQKEAKAAAKAKAQADKLAREARDPGAQAENAEKLRVKKGRAAWEVRNKKEEGFWTKAHHPSLFFIANTPACRDDYSHSSN